MKVLQKWKTTFSPRQLSPLPKRDIVKLMQMSINEFEEHEPQMVANALLDLFGAPKSQGLDVAKRSSLLNEGMRFNVQV
jgi:hypothetical protein